MAHPERILTAWWGTAGWLLTVSVVSGEAEISGSLKHFPAPVLLAVVFVLAVSGTLITFVTFRPSDATSWAIERLGWILAVGAWIAYGSGLVAFAAASLVGFTLPLAMVLLSIVRLKALGSTEVAIRRRTGTL
jgi:hypothetical protein